MTQKTHITIPTSLLPELEAWGEMRARIFGRLRDQAGLKPVAIADDQGWYWTERWQQLEKGADADIKGGRVKQFGSFDELIADLKA